MSTNLFYVPSGKRKENCLSNDLKYILSPRYLGHDGSLSSSTCEIGLKDVDFLEGIKAGTCNKDIRESVQELLDAISRYGGVEIWTE